MADASNITVTQSTTGYNATSTLTISQTVTDAEINGNTIKFGNGNGDYVALDGPSSNVDVNSTVHANPSGTASELVDVTVTQLIGSMDDNNITFGGGSGDYVSAVANFSKNTIVFGNGAGDYVSVSQGTSSGNTIVFEHSLVASHVLTLGI